MRRRLVGNRVKKFKDYQYVNDDTYYDYLERLKKIALSMFEWVNLPDSMDSRYIEWCLYYSGQAALLKNSDDIFINTRACSAGELNIYELPTQINCYSVGYSETRKQYDGYDKSIYDGKTGKFKEIDPKDYCIYVLNNQNRYATAWTLELFAYRLYLAQRTADINITVNKLPYIVAVDDNQRLTMENLINQLDENKPAVFGTKELASTIKDSLKVLPTNPPFIADKLNEYKKEIWNEALTFLGINNLNEKKERLITDETNSNNELINLNLQSYLVPRKEACKRFNKLFGLTGDKAIDVKVRSDLYNIIKQEESIIADYNDDGKVDFEDVKDAKEDE